MFIDNFDEFLISSLPTTTKISNLKCYLNLFVQTKDLYYFRTIIRMFSSLGKYYIANKYNLTHLTVAYWGEVGS